MADIVSYIEKAGQTLREIGIIVKSEREVPALKLLDVLSGSYDNSKVLNIGRILQQQSQFNAVVREQITGLSVANRQNDIVGAFDTIRDDAESMLEWFADGKYSMSERVKNGWMRVRRGSIPARFDKIKEIYLDVSKDAAEQIKRERTVIEAYMDFRLALKQGEIDAKQLLEEGEVRVSAAQAELQQAHDAVERGGDAVELAKLQLKRDEALRRLQTEDERYQIVKDLCDNLVIAYNSAEVVFARLNQSTMLKERVYRQSVTFFSTNEIVFTALSASISSLMGLSEATKTLDAMKTGVNESMELLGRIGNAQMEESLKAGYGATIKADSIKSLVNAIVDFQESSIKMITELRREATDNATEIDRIVSDGKQRYVQLLNRTEHA